MPFFKVDSKNSILFFALSLLLFKIAVAETPKAPITPPQAPPLAEGLLYAGPQLNEEAVYIQLGADYLLWVVSQEGLETAINNLATVPVSGNPLVPVPGQGTSFMPRFKPRNGFKVHGDVVLRSCEDVDLFLEYIWLDRSAPGITNTTNSDFTYPQLVIAPVIGSPSPPDEGVYSVSSSYKFEYNVLDFEIGRLNSFGRSVFISRQFWGLRGTWQTAFWNTSYVTNAYNPNFSGRFPAFANAKQQTNGAGVRGGLDFGFNLSPKNTLMQNLMITGTIAASGIFGATTVTWQSGQNLSNNRQETYQYTQNRFYRITPVLDLSLGLGWNYSFGKESNDWYNIEIHASWDTQSWIGFGQFTSPTVSPGGAQNMTVQGLTVGGSLFF